MCAAESFTNGRDPVTQGVLFGSGSNVLAKLPVIHGDRLLLTASLLGFLFKHLEGTVGHPIPKADCISDSKLWLVKA